MVQLESQVWFSGIAKAFLQKTTRKPLELIFWSDKSSMYLAPLSSWFWYVSMSDDTVRTVGTGYSSKLGVRWRHVQSLAPWCVFTVFSPCSFSLFFLLFCYSSPFSLFFCLRYLFYVYWWHLGHFLNNLIHYLAVLGLSCGTWDLSLRCRLILQHTGSVALWLVDLSSLTRGWARVPCAASWIVNHQATGKSHCGHFLNRKQCLILLRFLSMILFGRKNYLSQ